MSPKTWTTATPQDFIHIHDSDSEPETLQKHTSKKQKTCTTATLQDFIIMHDSDSEPETLQKHTSKKQKTGTGRWNSHSPISPTRLTRVSSPSPSTPCPPPTPMLIRSASPSPTGPSAHHNTILSDDEPTMDIYPEYAFPIENGSSSQPRKAPKVPPLNNTTKNAHLKGRKRFTADLADMQEACKGDFAVCGYRVDSA